MMATKLESDYPSSPANDESEGEEQDSLDQEEEEVEEEVDKKPVNNNVADILKRLQSSGALLKKPKQEFRCFTCEEDYPDWLSLENHLIEHVSLPTVLITKLSSDDEDGPPSGDENWSDNEDVASPPKPALPKTPQKIDISEIMNKTGLSIKKQVQSETTNSNSALSKLSGLGLSIKKGTTPVKQEKPDADSPQVANNNDVMQKLGKLGGLKLKLKSDGGNSNSFKVIKGLKDFKTSDDEDGASENEEFKEEQGGETDQDQDKEGSGGDQDSGDEQNAINNHKGSESDESEVPLANKKIAIALKNLQVKQVIAKTEPVSNQNEKSTTQEIVTTKPVGRPAVKQTPKRGTTLVVASPQAIMNRSLSSSSAQGKDSSTTSTPERRESRDVNTENVVVKQEIDSVADSQTSLPLFSGQIKSERSSPPPDSTTIPTITSVKTEPDSIATTADTQPMFQSNSSTTPLLPVTKTEDSGMTVIEINGDSNDEDDDCCVVSATPAPDIKPVIPKTENIPLSYPPPAYASSQSSYSGSSSVLSSRLSGMSTEKQHSFNWNAPDTKPPIDMLEKSADDIFESLLSTKKESSCISDASEYISLDTLGPQHSCEVCNTRFTDISLLEEHRRMTGHSKSIISPSSTLMPYNPSSNILSSLLPVKQLAEQVGKLSAIGGTGPGFTHQQNVMINIQAYPGAGGVMVQPQPYNNYGTPNMHSGYAQPPNNMYGAPGQTMPGQYPGQSYMGPQGFGQQFQPPMSKPAYMPPTSPYATTSPLQGMQQTVYGQTPPGIINSGMGQMGPPVSSYVPTSSPSGAMRPPTSSGVRIQNVQTFTPGQLMNSGQVGPDMSTGPITAGQPQMPAPGPIRMAAGANITGTRPRLPSIRPRPSIRPGIQVHGQVRGAKPRMPMKRPAGMAPGPGQKRRPDMLLPGKHDNEDCQVMAMQKQRDGLPMIHSVQGAKDKLNLGSQISITKKTVNKEANAMAGMLASRGISVKQKQKSRSPSPDRPIPHIPNLGAGMSIKHTSKSSNFTIPESTVGGGMLSCKICKKMFMNHNSLAVHMSNAHPQSKIPSFKCDDCPASYPKSLQLQHHKRVFHNVSGANRELGLPVVDLSQEGNLKRLSNLGIYSYIPLANREQASGCFGIPVISVHNMQNGLTNSLQALGADGLLSLGPLKPLPNS